MLSRAAVLLVALLAAAAPARAADAPDCANDLRQVREALARDQNLADEGRRNVEQLLRDAQAALTSGDQVVCKEMMEDARELLGLDSND